MMEKLLSELRSETRTCVVLLATITVVAGVALTLQTWAMLRYAAAIERIAATQGSSAYTAGHYASRVQTSWDNHMLETSRKTAETVPEWGAQHKAEVVGMVEALKD